MMLAERLRTRKTHTHTQKHTYFYSIPKLFLLFINLYFTCRPVAEMDRD